MSRRYLVREVVHVGHRIDARDLGAGSAGAVCLVCEKKQFKAALFGGRGPLPVYFLCEDAWPVDDPVDCMSCLVVEARRA